MLFAPSATAPHLLSNPNLSPRARFEFKRQRSRSQTPPPDSLSSLLQSPERSSPPKPPSKSTRAPSIPPTPKGSKKDDLDALDRFNLDQDTPSQKKQAPHYWAAQTGYCVSPPWLSPRVYPTKESIGREQPAIPLASQDHKLVLSTLIREMTAEAEKMAAAAYKNGYQYAMRSLLNSYSSFLSPSMRDVLSILGTGVPEQRPVVSKWQPPPFEDAENYISDVCRKKEHIVPLGILNGSPTRISLHGYVLRQGDGENDLYNPCIMNIFDAGVSRKIPVVFLGTLLGTGTAVLLDNEGNVWLHSPTMTVDDTIPNFDGKAGIVLKKGEFGSFERIVVFDRVFNADVTVVVEEEESDG